MNRLGAALLCVSLSSAFAQSSATVRGLVVDAQGSPISEAIVSVQNALTGFSSQAFTSDSGEYQMTNIPFQSYVISATKDGFSRSTQTMSLRTNIPQQLTIQLAVATQLMQIEVSASDQAPLVDPEGTGTRTTLNAAAMNQLPVAPTSRGLESVLLTFPGFAANANGAIHPRGAHNQMTYVIDGMPVSDQLTGAFANAVDPSIVQTIELFTGNIPAEYGSKVSGVAAITTRSGMGAGRRFSGSTQVTAAQFDTAGTVTQFAGGGDKWGYFASFNALKSNRYLDQVSIDNLHNGGNSERSFARIDYQASARDLLRLNLMAGRSAFQLANLRSQHANGQAQRQTLQDVSLGAGWLHTVGARTTVDAMFSYRTANARLDASPGDTPVTASQDRTASTIMSAVRWNHEAGRHTWRTGLDHQHFPIREAFTFGITRADFNAPGSDEFIPTLVAHDLTRGGSLFRFNKASAGNLYSAFAQDTVRLGRLVLTLGLRFDAYRFLAKGNQLQPRVGLAYHLRETGTVLRASYNRTYQTPPNENLLLSSAEESGTLVPASVRQTLGRSFVAIRPERQNVYEVGVQQSLGRYVSFSGAFYHKQSHDLQDNDNFLNTGIIFPTSLAQSRTNGAEGRFTFVPVGKFSGSVSFTHYHTIVTPPFTGGLFIGSAALNALSSGPFVIDHDQALGMQTNLQYSVRRNFWVSGAVRYDSGLVSNPSDPVEVANDPDYADLLPHVNLASDPPRVRPRTIVDLAAGYEHHRNDRRAWEAVFQVSNVSNVTALYNFQSIFVGTRLVQPRTASIRLRFFF
ncbi:MAG TPA: TonB-dependent receptor [Bryobacteraceae bacterium]|nr:TonB-dependent receptor [Bryobacteraceae bacterium]